MAFGRLGAAATGLTTPLIASVIRTMLSVDDPRWRETAGGYRVPFDPPPFFARLESVTMSMLAWAALWQ